MITVMGATGHTGKKIAEALLKAGEQVRALGRSESKFAELQNAGAEVLAGNTRLVSARCTGAFFARWRVSRGRATVSAALSSH